MLTLKVLFSDRLCSPLCVELTRVVSRVSEHNRKQPPTAFSQEMMGKCIWPLGLPSYVKNYIVAEPKSYQCVCKSLSYGQCFSSTQVSSKTRIFFSLKELIDLTSDIKRE